MDSELSTPSGTAATALSAMIDGAVSHDQIWRFLGINLLNALCHCKEPLDTVGIRLADQPYP